LEQVVVEELSPPLRGGDPMAIMLTKSWQRFDPVRVEQEVITSTEASARYNAHFDPARTFSSGSVVAPGADGASPNTLNCRTGSAGPGNVTLREEHRAPHPALELLRKRCSWNARRSA
jgi:hypothetical protein